MANRSGIAIKPSHEGDFHRWAGVPQGQPIPASKIAEGLRVEEPARAPDGEFRAQRQALAAQDDSAQREMTTWLIN